MAFHTGIAAEQSHHLKSKIFPIHVSVDTDVMKSMSALISGSHHWILLHSGPQTYEVK